MRILLFILVITSLVSCSSQWHLKRALEKDPSIISTFDKDTVFKVDTIFKKDTVLKGREYNIEGKDSIFYEDAFIIIKTVVDTINGIKTRTQIIYKDREVEVEVPVHIEKLVTVPAKVVEVIVEIDKPLWKYWQTYVLSFFMFILGFITRFIIKIISKK